jgi:1,2-dihydroxy-3-keto-5-methylthiopentene dioxygenase
MKVEKLRIFDESGTKIKHADDNRQIAEELNKVGVVFEQWQTKEKIEAGDDQEKILSIYRDDVERLVKRGGYQTWDVIHLDGSTKDAETLKGMRGKFLSEHRHAEDEVRFFVRGQGLFSLHIADKIYVVLCQAGDLISVPENTLHWFDMGESPFFTCIRLFNNPEGWVAQYSESQLDQKFPRLANS